MSGGVPVFRPPMTSQQDVTTCMALPFPAAFLMATRPLPILRKRQCGPVAVVQTLHRGFRLLVGVDMRGGGARGQPGAVDLLRGRLWVLRVENDSILATIAPRL
jgi:hypothetical protein